MAEFMEDADDEAVVRRERGQYINPIVEMQNLSQWQRDRELLKRFRFPEHGINYLCQLLKDQLEPAHGQMGLPVPLPVQIMVTLHYLASDTFQLHISDTFKMNQTTVSRVVFKVTKALAAHCGEFIHFPNVEQANRIKGDFLQHCNLPFVIGCVDGSQIPIEAPKEDERSYVNRKNTHSINFQGIVDSDYKFINADARWPGSAHDASVLRNSDVWDHFESGQAGPNTMLLGDSGYPLKFWLMVPFSNPGAEHEWRFNSALSRGRVKIEMAFGQLKRRFSINHTGYRISTEKIPDAIISTVILHNIAADLRLPDVEEEIGDDDQPENDYEEVANRQEFRENPRNRQRAIERRNDLANRLT